MVLWVFAWLLPCLAGTADDAAAQLSRYPTGMLPDSTGVLTAIEQLGDHGSHEHVALLESLIAQENTVIRAAAEAAQRVLDQRLRRANRVAFAANVPTQEQARAWWRGHRSELQRANGSRVGRHEGAALGYAVLVLGDATGDVPPADQDLSAADRQQVERVPGQALVYYARVAALGDAKALEQIRAFGVDPEPLLLGMSTTVAPEVPRVQPQAVEVLVREGGSMTIQVLAERAESGGNAERVVSVDALGRMLTKDALTAADRSAALRTLRSAAKDRDIAVRETARTALEDNGLARK